MAANAAPKVDANEQKLPHRITPTATTMDLFRLRPHWATWNCTSGLLLLLLFLLLVLEQLSDRSSDNESRHFRPAAAGHPGRPNCVPEPEGEAEATPNGLCMKGDVRNIDLRGPEVCRGSRGGRSPAFPIRQGQPRMR